jgi:hypothetical protein
MGGELGAGVHDACIGQDALAGRDEAHIGAMGSL